MLPRWAVNKSAQSGLEVDRLAVTWVAVTGDGHWEALEGVV